MAAVKTLLIGDTEYEITKEYREGSKANHDGVYYHSNPYQDGTQNFYDWKAGHENEDEVPLK